MGNCQAVDNATIVIQHRSGKSEKLNAPISAKEIMKLNPGHYVALLLTTTTTTTLYSSANANKNEPLRITRIKLLRPTDTLLLGHVYRLVTSQEVMKGLWAKKQAKLKEHKVNSDFDSVVTKTDVEKKTFKHQVKEERRHKSRNNTAVNSAVSKSRAWQPALNSISEAES